MPLFIVRVSTCNITGAVLQDESWMSGLCFAHMLQLSIEDERNQTTDFSEVCRKARCVVGCYICNAQTRNPLHSVQQTFRYQVLERVQDVPTRWTSQFRMLTQLLDLHHSICMELSKSDKIENLSNSEQQKIAFFLDILMHLGHAMSEACWEKYPVLSAVILKLLMTKTKEEGCCSALTKNPMQAVQV